MANKRVTATFRLEYGCLPQCVFCDKITKFTFLHSIGKTQGGGIVAILNIILKTVKPDQRIFLSIYRDFNFYFSKLETIFPLNFSSSLDKCYMGISVYKSYRVS